MYHPAFWTAPLFYFPGLLYEGVVAARNRLFASGWLQIRRLPAPVISVGNLTLGGSGKSPLILYIARLLARQGARPAILSRGYGRAAAGREILVAAPETQWPLAAAVLGDEPALMRRHVPEAWLGISADRYAAGQRLLIRHPQSVFLLDDGFQHRSLHRDLDIVVIDSTQPFESNRMFPRGSLREPLAALARCDAVIINGTEISPGPASLAARIRAGFPSLKVFSCSQHISSIIPFQSWQEAHPPAASGNPPHKVFLVAALGNPGRFCADVEALGLEITGTRYFRDHYGLKASDWSACIGAARKSGAEAILITEKDAIKMADPPAFPVQVCVQSTRMAEAEEFATLLRDLVRSWK